MHKKIHDKQRLKGASVCDTRGCIRLAAHYKHCIWRTFLRVTDVLVGFGKSEWLLKNGTAELWRKHHQWCVATRYYKNDMRQTVYRQRVTCSRRKAEVIASLNSITTWFTQEPVSCAPFYCRGGWLKRGIKLAKRWKWKKQRQQWTRSNTRRQGGISAISGCKFLWQGEFSTIPLYN